MARLLHLGSITDVYVSAANMMATVKPVQVTSWFTKMALWLHCMLSVLPCMQVQQFSRELQALPASTLLAAAFMTYLPGEPEDARSAAQQQWATLLGLEPQAVDMVRFMATESETLTWKAQGTYHAARPSKCICAKCSSLSCKEMN